MDMYQKRKIRAEKKNNDNQKSFSKFSISWYPGHMLKTKKQIIEDLKLIDVVIEILDARIPMSSQNPDIKVITQNKKKIILLNKSDMADDNETKKWQKYFETNDIPTIITNANLGNGVKEIIEKVKSIMSDDLKKAVDKGRQNKNIRLMVVGIPNVGKSSIINRLTNRKTAEVGNKPGVTKQKQWVRIDNNIELLDTPGMLWPKFQNETVSMNLSYIGTIKDELLPRENIAYELVKYLWEKYKNNVIERYKLTDEEKGSIISQDEKNRYITLIEILAQKRGAITKGGEVDYEKISNIIINDFRTGKLGKVTLEVLK